MTPTTRLEALLRATPASPVSEDAPPGAIATALARLRPIAPMFALFETMIARDTSFGFGQLWMYPAVLARVPWDDGVLGDDEVCVGKNAAGDLYLLDVATGLVRLVIHDEGWESRYGGVTFDDLVYDRMWSELENLEIDDVDDTDATYRARLAFAIEVAGRDALSAELRDHLVGLGVIAPG